MLHTWPPPTTPCYDLSTVFTLNGLSPHAAFKPVHNSSTRQPYVFRNSRKNNYASMRYANPANSGAATPSSTNVTSSTAVVGDDDPQNQSAKSSEENADPNSTHQASSEIKYVLVIYFFLGINPIWNMYILITNFFLLAQIGYQI